MAMGLHRVSKRPKCDGSRVAQGLKNAAVWW